MVNVPAAARLDELIDPYVHAHRVGGQGRCLITGAQLDARTAVAIEDAQGRLVTVMSPEGWEQEGQAILGLLPGATVKRPS